MKVSPASIHYPLIAFLILCFHVHSIQSQMIANIMNDVTTAWGTYHPNRISFDPAVPPCTVAPDLGNIGNMQQFSRVKFTKQDTAFLHANQFTVIKSGTKQFSDIYNRSTNDSIPAFITTDAVLHIYHSLFDNLLANIETNYLGEYSTRLTQTLFDSAQTILNNAQTTEAREAALRNLAFLGVPLKLLKGNAVVIPQSVAALVDSELVLISQHAGSAVSPVLGTFSALIDYSQFVPRGHYTKSDILKTYFQVMMWYGSAIFTMEPDLFGNDALRHSLQALLLTQMLDKIPFQGDMLVDIWKKIYDPTAFFVGKSDDPCVKEYKTVAEKIYGNAFPTLSADSLANSTLLELFMAETRKLPEPKIPNYIVETGRKFKGFRFMGQRFMLDSYMFAHLVNPDVPSRSFPLGLDILAILGSQRSFFLLDSQYQQTKYDNYTNKINEFKIEFARMKDEAWVESLAANWLYCFMPLLYKKENGYPSFMQTGAWADKELMTALASWAELRRDVILYSKQSIIPISLPKKATLSYVEPNPHLYNRLSSLVRYTREGLASQKILPLPYKEKLDLFESLLYFLTNVSIRELENTPLTQVDNTNMLCFGKIMDRLIIDTTIQQVKVNRENMAVIADVHTDPTSKLCLEEGVGYPLEIYVVVNEGGIVRLTRGAIFSYYEFHQPMAQRLTDEQWRAKLDSCKAPPLPEWAAHFTEINAPQPGFNDNSVPNYMKDTFTVDIGKEQGSGRLFQPDDIRLIHADQRNLSYSVAVSDFITIELYNMKGKKIKTLVKAFKEKGTYTVSLNYSRIARGAYVVVFNANKNISAQRVIIE